MIRVQVVGVTNRSGTSKAGQPYSMSILKCVTTDTEDGVVEVGELVLPQEHAEVQVGTYTASLSVRTDREGRLVGRVVALKPLKTGG